MTPSFLFLLRNLAQNARRTPHATRPVLPASARQESMATAAVCNKNKSTATHETVGPIETGTAALHQ